MSKHFCTALSILLVCAVTAVTAVTAVHADVAPAGLRLSGTGSMRFLGLEVYQAQLWVGPQFRPGDYAAHPLTLELDYRRDFTAKAIAERSIREMRRVGSFTESQAQKWEQALQAALPDVKAGDRITGQNRPGVGAVFRVHGRTVGEIADAEFARLFFGIWLSPQTSQPALREALLSVHPHEPGSR